MKPLNIIIAGGGTMGTSLVQIFSQNAFPVTLYSRRKETLERAKDRIAINQKALVQQNILSGDESEALVRRISFSDDKACFADADLVIENITEDMEAKKTVLAGDFPSGSRNGCSGHQHLRLKHHGNVRCSSSAGALCRHALV